MVALNILPLNPPLTPRAGSNLQALIVARISTDKQDERSLADQIALCQRYVREHYGGKVQFEIIHSQGSGEYLDRAELNDLEHQIQQQKLDLVIVEDLGRICRRLRALDICEQCVDCGVRLISINDHVDTSLEGWEDVALFSAWHHERSNRETSKRIKRSQENRFLNGGVVQFTIFGYLKPPGAKSDADLLKDPAAEPFVDGILQRLKAGASYAEVADWLNDNGVKPGPYCRNQR